MQLHNTGIHILHLDIINDATLIFILVDDIPNTKKNKQAIYYSPNISLLFFFLCNQKLYKSLYFEADQNIW
jgi:hypothetical protein